MTQTHSWGTHAGPGKGGLTLGATNIGFYGEIPDVYEDLGRLPRGAYSVPGLLPSGNISLRTKAELWAEDVTDLYEEAISRRWVPAKDVPWAQCARLPEDVEIAMAQVCTELSQHASVEAEVISTWLERMSYGYHEVKLYLATQVFECGRHFEVFRKRALVNGGGLGLESPSFIVRLLLESRAGWSETAALLYLLRGTLIQTIYRYLAAYAPTPADEVIFSRAVQDKARHLAYGAQHLRYAVSHRQHYDDVLHRVLTGGEFTSVQNDRDPVLWEALAIVFGGGVRGMDEGMTVVRQLRRDYVKYYLDTQRCG